MGQASKKTSFKTTEEIKLNDDRINVFTSCIALKSIMTSKLKSLKLKVEKHLSENLVCTLDEGDKI